MTENSGHEIEMRKLELTPEVFMRRCEEMLRQFARQNGHLRVWRVPFEAHYFDREPGQLRPDVRIVDTIVIGIPERKDQRQPGEFVLMTVKVSGGVFEAHFKDPTGTPPKNILKIGVLGKDALQDVYEVAANLLAV